MRRRTVQISRYLQANDPVAEGAELRAHPESPPATERREAETLRPRTAATRSKRRLLAIPVALGVAAAAIALSGALPESAPSPARFLSPEEALAAAASGLETDGILEWTDVQGGEESSLEQTGGDVITRWVDLETGDASEFHDEKYIRRRTPGQPTASVWNIGRENWLDEGERNKTNGKRVVRHTVVDRPPRTDAEEFTPVKKFQKLLDRALRGDLPYRAAGSIDGVPVVVITDVRKTFTSRSWITRERTPRLVKGAFTMPCPVMDGVKMNCSQVSDDGSARGGSTGYTKTLTWKIHPRTAEFIAKVHPPAFDPAKYVVITEHRD